MTAPGSMIKAARLWEKTSAKGNKYFTGRWGGCRVLLFENPERGSEGEADWNLFLADAEKREEGRTEPSGLPQRTYRQRREYRAALPPVRPDSVSPPDDLDDPLPF